MSFIGRRRLSFARQRDRGENMKTKGKKKEKLFIKVLLGINFIHFSIIFSLYHYYYYITLYNEELKRYNSFLIVWCSII